MAKKSKPRNRAGEAARDAYSLRRRPNIHQVMVETGNMARNPAKWNSAGYWKHIKSIPPRNEGTAWHVFRHVKSGETWWIPEVMEEATIYP